jgi:diguanylate cyclase (GGDEF)-like protein
MMKLMIVDDSIPFTNALKAILQDMGYEDIVMRHSVKEAIDYLNSDLNKPSGTTDIILMDVMMPGINGIEGVRQIKAIQEFRDIPVIMISAIDEETQIEEAFEAGAIDYIGKPIKKVELRARVRSILKLKEERDNRKANEQKLAVVNKYLARSNKQLQILSVTDSLTGIANRRYFDNIMIKEWRRAVRDHKELSLIMVDIDHFKQYNDFYGHIQGDTCLKKVVTALKKAIKRSADMIARYGGEEFVALLPSTDSEGAKKIAVAMQKATHRMKEEHIKSPVDKIVTVSIGIATSLPKKDGKWETLIDAADNALYQAKSLGRDQIVTAAPYRSSIDH